MRHKMKTGITPLSAVNKRVGLSYDAPFMKKLSPELFKEYAANPLGTDEKVRAYLDLPENRYYTVAMDGPNVGMVRVNNQVRTVKAKKISKSDQK